MSNKNTITRENSVHMCIIKIDAFSCIVRTLLQLIIITVSVTLVMTPAILIITEIIKFNAMTLIVSEIILFTIWIIFVYKVISYKKIIHNKLSIDTRANIYFDCLGSAIKCNLINEYKAGNLDIALHNEELILKFKKLNKLYNVVMNPKDDMKKQIIEVFNKSGYSIEQKISTE